MIEFRREGGVNPERVVDRGEHRAMEGGEPARGIIQVGTGMGPRELLTRRVKVHRTIDPETVFEPECQFARLLCARVFRNESQKREIEGSIRETIVFRRFGLSQMR